MAFSAAESTASASQVAAASEVRRVVPDVSSLLTTKVNTVSSIKLDPTIVPAPILEDSGTTTQICGLCVELSNVDCLASLEDAYSEMSAKEQLTFLKDSISEWDSYCNGQTDKACLTSLDRRLRIENNADRLTYMSAGCVSYFTSSTTEALEAAEKSDQCTYCADLDDAACLSMLESLYTTLNDKDKLAFLKDAVVAWATNECSSLTDKACLASLDSYIKSQTKTDRLALLESGCASYYSTSNMPDPSIVGEVSRLGVRGRGWGVSVFCLSRSQEFPQTNGETTT